jgi:DNA-binding LytR/AlgR family response regulator
MKIAICDDEPADLSLIQNYCNQYDSGIPTSTFSNGEALLEAFKKDFYDLVFLDIEMGQMNGLEVGARLVNMPHKPIIVFTTQSLNYAVRGYGIAMRYLPKPISYDVFSKTISIALEQIQPKKLSIISNGTQMFIAVNQIMYIEVLSHQVMVYMSNGEKLSMRGTLSDIISQIPGGTFVQPHKSYYINMDYIDRLTQQCVTMTNGASIPIGRSKKDTFHLRLSDYMKG